MSGEEKENKKMKKPTNCMENLNNCFAICCRTFTLRLTPKTKRKLRMYMKKQGIAIIDITDATEDIKKYWSLHEDCEVKGNRLIIKNPRAKIYDTHVVFFKKCTKLNKKMLCSIYGKKERPEICDQGHTKDTKNVLFDKKCIYTPKDIMAHDTMAELKKRGEL